MTFTSCGCSALQNPEKTICMETLSGMGPYEIGEAYARGDIDIQSLDKLMIHVFSEDKPVSSLRSYLRIAGYYLKDLFSNPQRGKGVFKVADAHYNLGNDLFEAMLDSQMSYTCGYWRIARTLDEAQEAKLKLACEKLKLTPGMKVLDIGCGWGNFAYYSARHYGVSVTGITISEEQAVIARKRCEGLPVEIQIKDYRDVTETFDRVVSIEMIEAVGRKNLNSYFDSIHRCLAPEGLFLLQVISRDKKRFSFSFCQEDFLMWILRYIFPNGYLPTMRELVTPCRDKYVMEDLESFGLDYDKTLLAWCSNFDTRWPDLRERYSETFRRRWRFYLLSCAALFRLKTIQLSQVLYSKRPCSR